MTAKIRYRVKTVPLPLPDGSMGFVAAGPTRDCPDDYYLIRCAAEIAFPGDQVAYDFATEDFTPIPGGKIEANLPALINELYDPHRPLYVGCMGGTGRTGTLLALIVAQNPAFSASAAVQWVRDHYKTGAVETQEQFKQIETYAHRWTYTGEADEPLPSLEEQVEAAASAILPSMADAAVDVALSRAMVEASDKSRITFVHSGAPLSEKLRGAWSALFG